jgi:hypothetical protein
MTQVKDLQFARHFLLNEIDLDPATFRHLLHVRVKVQDTGEPDTASFSGNTLVVSQPSSLTRFLFVVLYNLLKNFTNKGIYQDKLSLGLLFACKDYVFGDYRVPEKEKKQPPILLDGEKLTIPHTIITSLIEPLVGKVKIMPVLFIESPMVDACEVAVSAEKFSKRFRMPFRAVSFHEYPIIVANMSIHNEAARMAHICVRIIEHSLGEDVAHKAIKNILLSEESDIGSNLVAILKLLDGSPIFVMDFLKFFKSNVTLNMEEERKAAAVRQNIIESDKYLSEYIKVAQQAPKYTPHVFKQWHEWALIMGLIEKQLAPMRGSMWPTTENVKPFEDEHRQMAVERAKEKGKRELNFEELLEVARDWYGHKAVQPGQLAEKLLSENRVWKT